MDEHSPSDHPTVVACLACEQSVPEGGLRCTHCGATVEGVSLYDPKNFVWLALFCSGIVPLYMASANLGRLGRRSAKFKMLGLGSAAYAVLFAAFAIIPDFPGLGIIGLVINAPVGWFLGDNQRSLYNQASMLGAKKASALMGTLVGIGLAVCLAVVTVAPLVGLHTIKFQQGVELMDQGRFEEAASIFDTLVRFDPDDRESGFNAAICHGQVAESLEEFREAIEHYRSAEKLFPDQPALPHAIGWCLLRLDEIEDSEDAFAEAKRIAPDDTLFMVDHSRALILLERFEEAIQELRYAAERQHPDRETIAYLLHAVAESLIELSKGGATAKVVPGAVIYHPAPPEDDPAVRREHLSLALAALEVSNEIDPTGFDSRALLATVWQEMGRGTESCEMWRLLVEEFPGEADGHFGVADCLDSQGDSGGALAAFESGLVLAPRSPEAYERVAEIHLAMGERDRARETSRRALFYEFVPVFFDIQYREDLIDVVEALYGHVYDEDASVSVAQHEVESLLAEGSMTSLRLVATFCWHHSHDELEARAFRGLEQQSLRATPLLRALFQNSNATCTARSAARALARAKAPGTFEMLVEALPSDTRATWAVDIAGAMDELGDPRAVPVLIRALQREARDEPRELQNEDEKMASFLGSLNQHGSEQARMRAALALGAFDTPDSIQALEAGLEEEVVGLGCTAALYRLEGDGDLLQQLEASLNVSDAPHSGMIATYLEDRVGTEVARAAAVRIRGD